MPKSVTYRPMKTTVRIQDKRTFLYLKDKYKNLAAGTQACLSVYPYIRESILDDIKKSFSINELFALHDIIHSERDPKFDTSTDMLLKKILEIDRIAGFSKIGSYNISELTNKINELNNAQAIILSEYIISTKRNNLKELYIKD